MQSVLSFFDLLYTVPIYVVYIVYMLHFEEHFMKYGSKMYVKYINKLLFII